MTIYNKIDYTLLKATAMEKEITALCEKAIEKECASVCIPPYYVPFVKEHFPTLTICTVIGFPLGNTTTEDKVHEIKTAIKNGADELDFVVNLNMVKNEKWFSIRNEFFNIRVAAENKIVKVILETCYLTEEEIATLCEIAIDYNLDFVKTSTGFGTGGATFKDVALMKRVCEDRIKIKASGGIRTKEDAEKFIILGADRLGMSKIF